MTDENTVEGSKWSSADRSTINVKMPATLVISSPLHSDAGTRQANTVNSSGSANSQAVLASTMYQRFTAAFVEELKRGCDNSVDEALLGLSTGIINISITFSLNKMIFRQQLHGFTAKSAIRQLLAEGLGNLYRGVLPPLIQKSGSVAIMFGSYDKIKSSLHQSSTISSSLHPAVTVWTSAVLAGWCEAVLMPFERIQTLLQDSSQMRQFKNTKDAFLRLPVEYSFREYYRGLTAILLRNGLSNAIFFSLRTPISQSTQELGAPKLASDFASGAVLGAFTSTVMYPLNTVKTHMQINLGKPFVGIYYTFVLVVRSRGGDYKKLFRGVHLNCTRALISWGIINMSYEFLKPILFPNSGR